MGKKTVFTRITPLPKNVPRQLVLDMLHSHEEIIRLNPVVTGVKSVDAPREAPSEEYFSSWYEIYETITVGLGYKKKISFKTVFHDHPWGCQTHSYAPFGVDLRNKYRVGGNQPGEPREVKELGIDTPEDGLYIREDVEIICSVPLTTNFVRKETKEAIGVMVDRISRKAELLDEGKLHAMFENGKLKTSKPNQEATYDELPLPSPKHGSPPDSPALSQHTRTDTYSTAGGLRSPALDAKGFGRYRDIAREGSVREGSIRSSYVPSYQQSNYGGPQSVHGGAELPGKDAPPAPTSFVSELPASTHYAPPEPPSRNPQRTQQQQQQYHDNTNNLYPQPLKPGGGGAVFRSELPGDTYISPQYQQQQQYSPPNTQHLSPHQQHPSSFSEKPRPQSTSYPSTSHLTQQPHDDSPALRPASLQPKTLVDPNNNNDDDGRTPSHASSGGGGYHITNPDAQQWQAALQNDPPIDDAYYRNARHSQGLPQPQPQPQQQPQGVGVVERFGRLSVQEQGRGQGMVKCPVCAEFEGDEAAVSHHVSKAHFS